MVHHENIHKEKITNQETMTITKKYEMKEMAHGKTISTNIKQTVNPKINITRGR